MAKSPDFKINNKRARFDYTIEEEYEAGMSLLGPEIKALRTHRAQIDGAYVKIIGYEAYLIGAHFHVVEGDPQRSVKLLLHKKELNKLIGATQKKGYSILPLLLFQKRGKAKLKIGLGRGKKQFEKRALLKERDEKKQIQRRLKTLI